MFINLRRSRQARNFTTNVPKILDLKSSSEQIFSENWRWVPLLARQKMWFCQADTMNIAYSYPGTHKRAPFLNLLQLVWGKTKKQYGNRYVYVFRGKQAHDPNTIIWFHAFPLLFDQWRKKTKTNWKLSLRLGSIRSRFHLKSFCVNSC